MKIIKYVFAAIIFFVAFIATGECFTYHINQFEQTFWGMTFEYGAYGREDNNTLIKEEIVNDLKQSNIDVFTVCTEYLSDKRAIKTIYGTDGALRDLIARGISPQIYNSIFIGETKILFKNFLEIENVYESDVFYVVGTFEDAARFKNISDDELNRYYTIEELREKSGSEQSVYATLSLIWIIAFLLVLLFTLYDVIIKKKEITVRMTLGESPIRMFIKSISMDSIVYILLYFSLAFFLEQFIHVQFKYKYLVFMFCVMLLINVIISLGIVCISPKKSLSRHIEGKKALIVTYIIKAICFGLTSLVISANIVLIAEMLDYYKQKEIFEKLDEYCYYKFDYTSTTINRLNIPLRAEESVWYEFDLKYGQTSICLVDHSLSFGYNAVLMNRNAIQYMLPYVSTDLKLKLGRSIEDKLYIFYPENINKNIVNDGQIQLAIDMFLPKYKNNYETVLVVDSYKGKSKILGINSQFRLNRSVFLRNPIIILDNTKQGGNKRYLNPLYTGTQILYSVEADDILSFLYSKGMENELIKITNAKDSYYYHRMTMERTTKLMSAISLFIVLLNLLLIIYSIKLEYTTNGIELTIKKTLGYSFWGRCKRALLIPMITSPFCAFFAIVASKMLHFGNVTYILCCVMSVLIIDVALMAIQFVKMERIRTALILKGANL